MNLYTTNDKLCVANVVPRKRPKYLLFTHIDLDGYGCAVLAKHILGGDVDIEYVNYGFENEIGHDKLLEKMYNYDVIYFTDISFGPEFVDKIDYIMQTTNKIVLLFDHHQSALDKFNEAGKYRHWMTLNVGTSGTMIFWQFLKKYYPNAMAPYEGFVTLVNDYDLWHHNYPDSKKMQFLWNKDKNYFLERFINYPTVEFYEQDLLYINEAMNLFEASTRDAWANYSEHIDDFGAKFGFITRVGPSASLVMSDILKAKPHLDYVVFINFSGISFRSTGYEVNKIAEALGGGGHAEAAGVLMNPMIDILASIKQRKIIRIEINLGKK